MKTFGFKRKEKKGANYDFVSFSFLLITEDSTVDLNHISHKVNQTKPNLTHLSSLLSPLAVVDHLRSLHYPIPKMHSSHLLLEEPIRMASILEPSKSVNNHSLIFVLIFISFVKSISDLSFDVFFSYAEFLSGIN